MSAWHWPQWVVIAYAAYSIIAASIAGELIEQNFGRRAERAWFWLMMLASFAFGCALNAGGFW